MQAVKGKKKRYFTIDMGIYKNQLQSQPIFFEALDQKLDAIAKEASKISKEHCGGRAIDAQERYGECAWCLDEKVKAIFASRPENIDDEVFIWFVDFHLALGKKATKSSFDLLISTMMGNDSSWMAGLVAGMVFEGGYNDATKRFHLKAPRATASGLSVVSLREVLKDTKNERFLYQEGFVFMMKNVEIFPKCLQKEVKRLRDVEDKDRVEWIGDELQYRKYLSQLPDKYTQAFIKNEMQRLVIGKMGNAANKSRMLAVSAFLEKYGLEELSSKPFFEKLFETHVLNANFYGPSMSPLEKNLVLRPVLLEAVKYFYLKKIGFDVQSEKEKEFVYGGGAA